jgi:predicted RecA/RadA family phage recombinase
MLEKLKPYRKTIAAVATGAIGWGALVVASDAAAITATEWIAGATAIAIALGVYTVPNSPVPPVD